jgi:hypothetical protein
MAQMIWGGNKERGVNSEPTTRISKTLAYEEGMKRMAAATPALEESSGSSGTSSEATKIGTVVSGTMPVTSKPPVTQQDFVDALTAVMTGKVAFSDDDNQDDDDDDDHSLSSVSTIGSRIELTPPSQNENDFAKRANRSLGIGQLFFYIEQNSPAAKQLFPSNTENALALITTQNIDDKNDGSKIGDELALVNHADQQGSCEKSVVDSCTDLALVKNANEDVPFDGSVVSLRSLIEAKAREADKDQLFEQGYEMYREGERLLYEGKVEEAREALQRAHSFQKRSLRMITIRMGELMHKQGLDHCDRGEKYLAIVLLGVAEILKHRPTPENVRMGAQIHRGYRRVAPKETKYRESRREIDQCVASIKREALPMAKTLHTYSQSLKLEA